MKHLYQKNKQLLESNHINIQEHDACGVGFVASTNGKPRRDVVTNGINALKAVWHRGAVDADGKTGDGAGLNIEFNKDFFEDKIASTGHTIKKDQTLCIGMVFLPRNNFTEQERCRTLMEQELLKNDLYIFGWRQVPTNPKVLGQKANDTRPEIEQLLFATDKELSSEVLEELYFLSEKKLKKELPKNSSKIFIFVR